MNKPLKKLRIQFITVMMSIVIVFLAVIFSVQYISSYREMKTSSETALKIALDEIRGSGNERDIPIDDNTPGKPLPHESDNSHESNNSHESDNSHDSLTDNDIDDDINNNINDDAHDDIDNDTHDDIDEKKSSDMVDDKKDRRMMESFGDRTARTAVLIVKVDSQGTVSSVRNDMFYMEDSYIDEVVSATKYSSAERYDIKSSPDNSHPASSSLVSYHVDGYSLRYAVYKKSADTYIAYVDESDNESSLKSSAKRFVLISFFS